MIYSLIGSVAVIAGLPRPVIPKEDRAFYPSNFARWFGWFSLIVFTAMSLGACAAERFCPDFRRS